MKDMGDNTAFVLVATVAAIVVMTITMTIALYYDHKVSEHAKVCREQPSVCIAQAEND